jgi:hypothetical protein
VDFLLYFQIREAKKKKKKQQKRKKKTDATENRETKAKKGTERERAKKKSMAEKEQPPPPSTSSSSSSSSSSSQASKSTACILPSRPTITLPPRSSMETVFNGGGGGSGLGGLGFSPGPMTLLSSFFSDTDDCRSFSQLLAGAMTSPAAIPSHQRQGFPPPDDSGSGAGDDDFRFRPNSAVQQSPMFTVPPGLSPAGLLDSPGLFSPGGQVILSMSGHHTSFGFSGKVCTKTLTRI